MLPDGWIEHRREDRELVGWIVADGEAWRPYDLLGRAVSREPIEWLDAEALLERLGIGYLADRWTLVRGDGTERPVRIAELDTSRIVVVADEFGKASAVGADQERFELTFPVDTDSLVNRAR
jgi:hypothetical protein